MAGRGAVALVYLAEAHASDEWPIGWRHAIAQTSGDAAARAAAAALFVAEQGVTLPLALDTADDAFDAAYAAWPLRAFGLLPPRAPGEAPVVDFVAQPRGEGYYAFREVEAWLLARCATEGAGTS